MHEKCSVFDQDLTKQNLQSNPIENTKFIIFSEKTEDVTTMEMSPITSFVYKEPYKITLILLYLYNLDFLFFIFIYFYIYAFYIQYSYHLYNF